MTHKKYVLLKASLPFVLLAAIVVGLYFLLFAPKDYADLVPADARAVLTVEPSALLANDMRLGNMLSSQLGFRPEGLDETQDVYIFITQLVAMTAYILYPSRQDLRPLVFERDNILTRIMGIIYAFDTNTGVCPSLHVGYSLGIASVWLKKKDASPAWKAFIVILVILICLATAFVKQHSVVDILWALPLGLFAEILTFHVIYKKKTV